MLMIPWRLSLPWSWPQLGLNSMRFQRFKFEPNQMGNLRFYWLDGFSCQTMTLRSGFNSSSCSVERLQCRVSCPVPRKDTLLNAPYLDPNTAVPFLYRYDSCGRSWCALSCSGPNQGIAQHPMTGITVNLG